MVILISNIYEPLLKFVYKSQPKWYIHITRPTGPQLVIYTKDNHTPNTECLHTILCLMSVPKYTLIMSNNIPQYIYPVLIRAKDITVIYTQQLSTPRILHISLDALPYWYKSLYNQIYMRNTTYIMNTNNDVKRNIINFVLTACGFSHQQVCWLSEFSSKADFCPNKHHVLVLELSKGPISGMILDLIDHAKNTTYISRRNITTHFYNFIWDGIIIISGRRQQKGRININPRIDIDIPENFCPTADLNITKSMSYIVRQSILRKIESELDDII